MRRCKVFALVVGLYFSISCCSGTDLLQDEDGVIRHVILEPEHVIRRRSVDQSLRISAVFVDIKAIEEPEAVKKALQEATEYFSKTFKVRKTVPEILLQRWCTNGTYVLKDGVRYCKQSCDSKRVCGSAEGIPLSDFDACRTCDADGNNCVNGTGPDSGPGKGHNNTDFVLYVTAIDKPKCKETGDLASTLAFASVCQQESGLDRPVVGSLNICPGKVTEASSDSGYGQLVATLKHEMFHALGFSPNLYAFYRNSSGFPLTPRGQNGLPPKQDHGYKWSEKTIKTVTRTDWVVQSGNVSHDIQVMVTPRVRDEVRRHFNCPTLEGAELENQGGNGTALAHWEKRLFENEGMTGTFSQNSVFSSLTLALMEDTGWYKVDYSMAKPLVWGKNLGCLFAKNSCKAWMRAKSGSVEPFCDKVTETPSSLKTGCTEDRTAVALCSLKKFPSALPEEYQYFESPNVGGGVMLADYCPYFRGFTWTENNVVVRDSTCTLSANSRRQGKNYALETYGETSRCFEQGMKWKRKDCDGKTTTIAADWGSGCYEHKCESDGLKIIIGGKKFRCYHQGQVISIKVKNSQQELYEGSLVCPPCKELCMTCPAEIKPAPEDSQPSPDVCSSAQVFAMKALLLYFTATLAIICILQ